jgi:hypothetical protein
MENFNAIRQYIDKQIEDGYELFLVPIDTVIESHTDWEEMDDVFEVFGSNSKCIIGVYVDDFYNTIKLKDNRNYIYYDFVVKCVESGGRGYENTASLVSRIKLSTLESVSINISLY